MKRLIVAWVFLLAGGIAFSQSSPNVPIDDHVYLDIERLVAAGLVKDAIYGQRPWSRNEIARLIAQARLLYEEKKSVFPDERNMATAIMAEYLIENLEQEYREELNGKNSTRYHLLEEVSTESVLLNSPYRAVPIENGVGAIKASVNPLISYREGRRYADGGTLAIESVHWATLSKYFSVLARPRFEGLMPDEGSSNADVRAQLLYGKFTLGNLEFEAGRDTIIWSSGEHGGVIASNNSRNLDMVKVSNDSPLVHPWIFKYLGPSKYTFFVADLGASHVLSNAYLYGFAGSFKPAPFLEIGFEHEFTLGGKGAPDIDFDNIVKEFFLYREDQYGQNLADHRIGVNARAQIPKLHHSVVYGEGIFEDLGRESFWPQFTQQMGFLAGWYFPLLTSDGSDDLRIEYDHVPAAYGRHYLWTSGLSEDDKLRGSELGPDGHGIHITWGHDLPSGKRWQSAMHFENRDSNIYTATLSSAGGQNEIVQVEDRQSESRFRVTTSLEWRTKTRFVVRPELGYERVWDFDFVSGANRNNFLAAVSVRWHPGFK